MTLSRSSRRRAGTALLFIPLGAYIAFLAFPLLWLVSTSRVNYGRDADSIASMAGAMAGALHGEVAIPAEWRETVSRSSRLTLREIADELSGVAVEIFAADTRRWEERAGNFPSGGWNVT